MTATYRPVFEQLRPTNEDKISVSFYNPENDDERTIIRETLLRELGPDTGIREENGLFIVDIQYMEELHVIHMIEEMFFERDFARMLRFKTVEVNYNEALLADDKGNKERAKAFQQQRLISNN